MLQGQSRRCPTQLSQRLLHALTLPGGLHRGRLVMPLPLGGLQDLALHPWGLMLCLALTLSLTLRPWILALGLP